MYNFRIKLYHISLNYSKDASSLGKTQILIFQQQTMETVSVNSNNNKQQLQVLKNKTDKTNLGSVQNWNSIQNIT